MLKQSRLLIVDSDKAKVASMTKHLQGHGFLVHAVGSGEKAIDIASKEKPDLVVVDIKLPGMSGFELYGRLHTLAEISDIPVLLIRTSGEIESSAAGQHHKYLIDANDFPSLSRKIKKLVSTYKRRRAIEELLDKEDVPVGSEGAQELTSGEQETLWRAGADLEDEDLGAEDPMLLGKMDYLNLLESSLTTAQASKLLGVNESRIRQRLTSKPPSLYGIKRDAEWLIPSFQFEGKKLIPHIKLIISMLDANLHPVSVWRWFTTPDSDLVNESSPEGGFSPRDWLLRGFPIKAVEELAEDIHLS